MTEQSSTPQAEADNSKEPAFGIQRIYLKDLSLEQPNAPNSVNQFFGSKPGEEQAHEQEHRN